VNNRNTLGIIDTGASISCLSAKFAKRCKIPVLKNSLQSQNLYTADSRKLIAIGFARTHVGLGDVKMTYTFHVVVKLNHPILFGIDFFVACSRLSHRFTKQLRFA